MEKQTHGTNRIVCAFFLGLLSTLCCFAASPAKLAIIAEDSAAQAAADLLTAVLSGQEQLALLDRSEIDRIINEQVLSASNGKNYGKLGETLGADGLLLLSVSGAKKSKLDLSLVAVKEGVILAWAQYPWPIKETAQWAKLMNDKLAPLILKLSVLAPEAVPLSIVGLQSAVKSQDSPGLDRTLSILLVNRLVQVKEVFVLERRRMQLLGLEKNLKGLDDAPFWRGSYVFEATVNKQTYSTNSVTISCRLVPPRNAPVIELETSGPRNDLPMVINTLATNLLIALKKQPAGAAWKPADEAQRYFDEAMWVRRWGMLKEWQAASESCWALGKHDLDSAVLRVLSFCEEAQVIQRTPIGFTVFQPGDIDRMPSNKVHAAIHALDLFEQFGQENPLVLETGNIQWAGVGVVALDVASELLRHFYHAPQAREGNEESLMLLRSRCRTVANLIANQAPLKGKNWRRLAADKFIAETSLELFKTDNIYKVISSYGGLWYESPRDALEAYKMLRLLDFGAEFPYTRGWFVAWRRSDSLLIADLWRSWLDELFRGATNVVQQIEMHHMAIREIDPNDQARRAELLERALHLVEFYEQHRALIASGEIKPSQIRSSETLLFRKLDDGPTSQLAALKDLLEHFRAEFPPSQPMTKTEATTTRPAERNVDRSPRITVSRFWQPTCAVPSGYKIQELCIIAAAYQAGKLWLQVFYNIEDDQHFTPVEKGVYAEVIGVNLSDFSSESIPYLPFVRGTIPVSALGLEAGKLFERHGPYMYFNAGTKLQRYHLQKKKWEDIPAPLDGTARLTAIEEKIYLSTRDTILEFDPQTMGTKILASTRRRPALGPLDSLPHLNEPPIFKASPGRIATCVENGVYLYDLNNQTWSRLATIRGDRRVGVSIQTSEAGTLLAIANQGWALWPGRDKLELLYGEPTGLAPANASSSQPVWQRIFSDWTCTSVIDGENLWTHQPNADPARRWYFGTNLWYFDRKVQKPICLALSFESPSASASDKFCNTETPEVLISTPEGLVMSRILCRGFWFIPRKEFANTLVSLSNGNP